MWTIEMDTPTQLAGEKDDVQQLPENRAQKLEDIQPMKERYQNVNKNDQTRRTNTGRDRIQQHTKRTTATNYKDGRHNTFNGGKLTERIINYNYQNITGQRNQPNRNNLHKIKKLF